MEFNTFYKLMRKSPQYDTLLESKEKDDYLKILKSREFFALMYANDLYDNKLKIKDILKLFEPPLHKVVVFSLGERLKAQQKRKLTVAWINAAVNIRDTLLHNKGVNDMDYFNTYYPLRSNTT